MMKNGNQRVCKLKSNPARFNFDVGIIKDIETPTTVLNCRYLADDFGNNVMSRTKNIMSERKKKVRRLVK